jgi:4-amino-4-deoxy-L-arabinose transferase-like glycosyltransferase
VTIAATSSLLDRLLRPGATSRRDVVLDVLWLLGLGLLLIGAGLGLRDPWPADEPRFALVAQDMLRSGDWLIPRIGGDLYADKPPLYFWLMAASMAITGSLRLGFLVPSLLSGLGTVLLVYDLLRRARGREVAFAGAFALLVTFQFVWQARQAQIDATLCFFTTLSLYGLLRHLATGPSFGWFLTGWTAAGLGVITKGVGFLPLFALLPWTMLAARGWPSAATHRDARWLAGPVCLLAAIGLWFLPMMLATSAGSELLAYRHEILYHQTVTRYADAWHHHGPFWFYFVEVVPLFWLPSIVLVPWLWPRWRDAWRDHDTLTVVLIAWVLVVLVFFSCSSGKRGLYVLPAVPALAMAAAPWLPQLMRARGPRRLVFGLAGVLAACMASAALYFLVNRHAEARIAAEHAFHPTGPLAVATLGAVAALVLFRLRDAWLAYAAVLGVSLLVVGFIVYPRMDAERSGRAFMSRVARASTDIPELGLVSAKEQYLLQLRRPSFNFGHARWREKAQEAADAALWLTQAPGRALVIDSKTRELCFKEAPGTDLGRANGDRWTLVGGVADPACIARGDPSSARLYLPPNDSINTAS